MKIFKFFHGFIDEQEYINVGAGIILPVARRVVGGTILDELVPVQPMNEPRGRLFYMDNSHNLYND